MKPLVSILVPCYNHEKYIEYCLESIVMLNYPRIEIIIIDDASDDGTFKIINNWKERLEERAERVVIERNLINHGIGKNRNKLWEQAKGDYYKFVDSDDYLLPDGIGHLVDYFEKNPECSVVHGNSILIDENGSFLKNSGKSKKTKRMVPNGYHLTSQLLEKNFIFAPSAMISKAAKIKYGDYIEKNMGEDWEYWLRVSVDGRIDYINYDINAYRILESSASHFSETEGIRHISAIRDCIDIYETYKKYATKKSNSSFFNSNLVAAYLCQSNEAVQMVKSKMRENKARPTAKTRIWIWSYKTGIYKFYSKLRNKK